MENDSEVMRKTREWKALYLQLLQISEEQRALTGDDPSVDFDMARFEELNRRWEAVQLSVVQTEGELRASVGSGRFRELFETHVLPVVRQIQTNIREASDWIEQAMSDAGGSIRSVREHRHARRAYGETEYGMSAAMFFDEKK